MFCFCHVFIAPLIHLACYDVLFIKGLLKILKHKITATELNNVTDDILKA